VGAALGALYSLLILPTGSNVLGISLPGVAWFLLSVSLLFLLPLAYHAFTLFGLAWGVYNAILLFRGGFNVLGLLLDVLLPLGAVALVMTSGYLAEAYAVREAEEG